MCITVHRLQAGTLPWQGLPAQALEGPRQAEEGILGAELVTATSTATIGTVLGACILSLGVTLRVLCFGSCRAWLEGSCYEVSFMCHRWNTWAGSPKAKYAAVSGVCELGPGLDMLNSIGNNQLDATEQHIQLQSRFGCGCCLSHT